MSYDRDYYARVIQALAQTRQNQRLKPEIERALVDSEEVRQLIHKLRDDVASVLSDISRRARDMSTDSSDIKPPPSDADEQDEVSDMMLTLNVPNARVGEDYQFELRELCPELTADKSLVLESDDGSGLEILGTRLIGIPSQASQFALKLRGCTDLGGEVFLTLKLAVIGRSRDLWKNLPTPPDDKWGRPEFDVVRQPAGEGRGMVMASIRGRAHAHRGLQRDDHGVVRHIGGDEGHWNVLVTADGAGSCQYSRRGAWLAATSIADHLEKVLPAELGNMLFDTSMAWWHSNDRSRMPHELITAVHGTVITGAHHAFKAISKEAEREGLAYRDFSTTLLVALEKPTETGSLVIAFGVGDGAIACIEGPDKMHLMNLEDSGEHAGQTRFLDGSIFQDGQSLYQRVQIAHFEHLEAVIVATDGVTDPCFTNEIELHSQDAWWQFYEGLRPSLIDESPVVPEQHTSHFETKEVDPLINYLNFFKEGFHDDRTIAVLFRCLHRGEQTDSFVQAAETQSLSHGNTDLPSGEGSDD